MAVGSLDSGKVTLPNVALFVSRSRLAPVPMYRLASDIEKVSRLPPTRVPLSLSGSTTPVTVLRPIDTVALPYTTSAMPIPIVPPICRLPSEGPVVTPAASNDSWVQSISLPSTTEVLFSFRYRLVPMIWNASTPWSWARPRVALRPMN